MNVRFAKVYAILLACLLGGNAAVAAAAPTPLPGGANQVSGVSGTFSDVLFNGTLRLRAMSLKDAQPSDKIHPNAAGERAVVFRAVVSNGTQRENHGYFDAMLADANGITVTGRPLDDGWSLQPGAAARALTGFSIPADFVPAKIVLIEAAQPNGKAFRIAIRQEDFAAAGKPADSQ